MKAVFLGVLLAGAVFHLAAPVRPAAGARLHATAGIFEAYGLVTDPVTRIIAQRLTIWDAARGQDVVYTVSPGAKIDGIRIACRGQYRLCGQLPVRLVPGKTWIALVYWQSRDAYPSTDEIRMLSQPPPQL